MEQTAYSHTGCLLLAPGWFFFTVQLQCNTVLEDTRYYRQFSCLHNYNNMLEPVQTSDAMQAVFFPRVESIPQPDSQLVSSQGEQLARSLLNPYFPWGGHSPPSRAKGKEN